MNQLQHLFGLSLLAAVLAACSGISGFVPEATNPAKLSPEVQTSIPPSPSPVIPVETQSPSLVSPTANSSSTTAPLTRAAIAACPVTFPNGSQPPYPSLQYPGAPHSPGYHGNGVLWAATGTGGKILVQPALVNADGSIEWKMGWHRGEHGKLTVTGRRLDAPAPPAQGYYDIEGYGDIGFQAGGITFPSQGCWEITGKVGEASLTFVTLVVKEPSFEYLEPAWRPEGLQKKDYDLTGYPQTIRVIWASPIWDKSGVTWGYGELSVETTQGVRENHGPYPEGATQPVSVHGQPGVCMQGDWDIGGQWQAGADAGALEWSDKSFSYRIRQTGLGLDCQGLQRIAGPSP